MKFLGVDYGTKRTGIAISDADARVSVVKETIDADGQQAVIDRIKEIVDEETVERIVVGVPFNMDGETSDMTDHVRRFIENLRNHVSIPVQEIDERLTTEMAKQLLRGLQNQERDQVAAQIMLQNFLDELSQSTK